MSADLPVMPDTVMVKGCCELMLNEPCDCSPLAVNAYWDAVKDWVKDDTFYGGPCVDWATSRDAPHRTELVDRYSWTVTDPTSVAFVVDHVRGGVVDPMAGSGWWCRLLADFGIDIVPRDIAPPHHGGNEWHKSGIGHVLVTHGDGPDVASEFGAGRTLLLSWPPYDSSLGADILAAYPGDRVIYIGEQDGGCCGDAAMFDRFRSDWTTVAERRPVQWWGLHDYITVYDRIPYGRTHR